MCFGSGNLDAHLPTFRLSPYTSTLWLVYGVWGCLQALCGWARRGNGFTTRTISCIEARTTDRLAIGLCGHIPSGPEAGSWAKKQVPQVQPSPYCARYTVCASKMRSCRNLSKAASVATAAASQLRYNSNIGLIGDVVDANNCQEKQSPEFPHLRIGVVQLPKLSLGALDF